MFSGKFLANLQKHLMIKRPGEVKSRLPLAGLGTDDTGIFKGWKTGSSHMHLQHLATGTPLFFFFKLRYSRHIALGKFKAYC